MPVFWGMKLGLVFLVGRSTSGGVYLGICGLIMILGSLSANGWRSVWFRVRVRVSFKIGRASCRERV